MILTELSGNLERLLDVQQVDFLDIELPVTDPNQSFTTLGGSANLTFNYVSLTRAQIDRLLTESLGKTPFVFGLTNNKFIAFPFWFYTPLDKSSTSIQYGTSVGHVIWNYCRYGRDTLPTLKVYDSLADAISADYNSWGAAWYVTPDSNRRNITEIQYMRFGFAHDTANKALYITMQMRVKDANGGIAYYTVGSSGATQLGANSSVDFGTPPAPQRGYYHGAIDGGTPARQFMRGGIDYLRTIDIYDETYYTHGSNAAFLKNKVGELPYNGVEFAYPNIIVKANTSLQFTHAVTASWSANNRPVVYEVIGYHELGNNLAEYTLRVDGLKTFYQYHTDKNPLVARHSNIANWNKWGIQNVPPSTTYRTGRKKINLANNLSLGGGWVCMVMGTKVYCLSSDDFNSITSWINAQDSPNYIYSQITRVFKSPFPGNAPGIGRSSISGITFNSINADGETILVTWSATSSYECYTTGVSSMSLSLESGIINSGVDLDNGEFTIFIPAYGDIKPSREALTLLAKGETLTLFYYMSLYTGETAVRLSCDTDVLPYVSLPTVDLQISTASQQIRLLNQSQENSRTSTAVGVGLGVAGLVASLATGNVAGAMGASSGLISSITGATLQTSNQAIQMQQALLNARSEVIAIGAAVGYRNADTQGGTNNDIELSYKIAEPLTNLDNYYATVGYPCGLPLLSCTTVSGDTIWLAWNRATLNDKKEIVDDLLIKSSEGIYWNP